MSAFSAESSFAAQIYFMRKLFFTAALGAGLGLHGQVLTKEDSLNAGLTSSERATIISGYGEAKVGIDLDEHRAEANLTRNVLFVGHRFSSKISLFTELEIEDAKVAGGEPGGEVAMEQVFLKFDICRHTYLTAGLIIPRIGITNENHLPTSFNGVDRPYVENDIIPATWREIGVAAYGQIPRVNGLNWSFGLFNGLNCDGFNSEEGIREGRFEGREASASNIAMSGALLYYTGNFRFQTSGYFGGTCVLPKADADTLGLKAGLFGTPVALEELDAQYMSNGFSFRLLGTMIQIPDANAINDVFGHNVAESMWGGYAEVGYNIFKPLGIQEKKLTVFARYEMMNLNATMPENGVKDNYLASRSFIVAGLHFQPLHGVSVKADFVMRRNGNPDPAIYGTDLPQTNFNMFNIGVGYSF